METKRKKKEEAFDYQSFEREAIEKLREGKGLIGPDGALTGLIKRILEASLNGEMDAHLQQGEAPNRRNGHTEKRVKTALGEVGIMPPRDRAGSFEPQLLPKWERTLTPELEEQMLSLYSMGNSYEDIQSHMKRMYGIEYSTGFITQVTERVWQEVETWRNRPLQSLYAFVYLDGIVYKVREDGKVGTKAIYSVLGVDMEGNREVLGLYIGQAEGAKHWGRVLENLRDRGVEDVLFFCVDGLKGFSQAIAEVYPQSIVQRCIVHMIRTSLKHVSYGDYKAICKDLRTVYAAPDRLSAEAALVAFGEKWDKKYPEIRQKWEESWLELSAYFDYSEAVRRVMYTTNAVEALHRQLRKVTKTKGAFVSEKALLKLLYLAWKHKRKSWERKVHAWAEIARVLRREFAERIEKYKL